MSGGLDNINERLEERADEAVQYLQDVGIQIDERPEVVFSPVIPVDEIAYYDPMEDKIYVRGDPDRISGPEGGPEGGEIELELQKKILRSRGLQSSELESVVDSYVAALKLEDAAKKPLNEISRVLEKDFSNDVSGDVPVYLPRSIVDYLEILGDGNFQAMERLVDEERTSTLDEFARDWDLDDANIEDIEFYKKVLEENYGYLEAALEYQSNLESIIQEGVKYAGFEGDKVDQAASFLIGPLKHDNLGEIKGSKKERLLENIEDPEVKEIVSEILSGISNSGGGNKDAFSEQISRARKYWRD